MMRLINYDKVVSGQFFNTFFYIRKKIEYYEINRDFGAKPLKIRISTDVFLHGVFWDDIQNIFQFLQHAFHDTHENIGFSGSYSGGVQDASCT